MGATPAMFNRTGGDGGLLPVSPVLIMSLE